MKLFIFSILFFASVMTAQKTQAANVDGFFGYSFADKFDIQGASDAESEDAFILGARISSDSKKNLGYNFGLGLDTIRDFKYSSASVGFFLLEGNVTLFFDDLKSLYGFAGLNYPMIILDKHVDTSPSLGIQFGTGFKFTPKWAAELYYRTVNMEINTHDANLWGFALRVSYSFAQF